ncbi:anti-sigma factor [Aquimarina sp. RZ0]|uniref:anti-sigma factor n=1 Tax=Aquimarina sp. RZ0 TaxID=2607730 RepID=UPI0011F20EF1|nr:anti-sigma factor [Aquimarina sp. RZ0]KAA1243483.1 anti-sigma factor [Aquimarina sp. RZ0]
MFKKIIMGTLAIGLIATSCSDDDDSGNVVTESDLSLDLNGLENLGDNYLYEGWVIVNGNPVSTGTFSVDDSGVLSSTTFSVNTEMLEAATAFVLSIEPNPDPDPTPAATKLLRGEFGTGDAASMAIVGLDPVGDFTTAEGTFFLRTPTDEDVPGGAANNMNDQYGVWFGIPGAPPTPSLILPALTGWKYEGWVIGDNGPISTGTFTEFGIRDDNAEDPNGFSETVFAGPPLPGEDFFRNEPMGVMFPLDIRGRTVVISVEPFPDNSPAPFLLKPLIGMAGMDTAPTSYNFELKMDDFPTGSVSR